MRKLLMLIVVLSTTAFGASIQLQQDGWSAGGALVVSFTGVDSDLDGSLIVDELTNFGAAWTTPGGGVTQWGLSEIEPGGFFFTDTGNFLLFVRNSEYSLVNTAFEGEFLATVFDSLLFPVDSTVAPAQVVPEPGSLALSGAAIVLLSAGLRRSRHHAPRAR